MKSNGKDVLGEQLGKPRTRRRPYENQIYVRINSCRPPGRSSRRSGLEYRFIIQKPSIQTDRLGYVWWPEQLLLPAARDRKSVELDWSPVQQIPQRLTRTILVWNARLAVHAFEWDRGLLKDLECFRGVPTARQFTSMIPA